MKPAPCPLRSESLSHWKGAEMELGDEMDGKNMIK